MELNNNIYTSRLKEAREAKEVSFRDMAKLLGYKSPSSYMYIEKGEVQPTIEMMNKISDILEGSVEYFFNLKVQETQTKEN